MSTPVVAFVGNPNVGKSTIFNLLTGLKQHTGNWTGKTVEVAKGEYTYKDVAFCAIDLPGTYSLVSNSPEEEITREFLCCHGVDVAVVICDMVCLERNLNLVYQALEITDNVIVCINLADYGKKKGFSIDTKQLSDILGVSVVLTSGKTGDGVENLKEEIFKVSNDKSEKTTAKINYNSVLESIITDIQRNISEFVPKEKIKTEKSLRWYSVRLLCGDNFIKHYLFDDNVPQEIKDSIKEGEKVIALSFGSEKEVEDAVTEKIAHTSHKCAEKVITMENKGWQKVDRTIDRYVTSKVCGIPLMIALLFLVFWLTITGANYPSDLLFKFFFALEGKILNVLNSIGINENVVGILVLGIYRVVVWVISVMLPPMAIFFPLFAVLEDLGYLPRIAFNLDNVFCKAGCCGKQALTTCMGFGCNAAGVVACRIISSPRERIIAVLTNAFVPCNGRIPTLIAIITMFFAFGNTQYESLISTLILTGVIVLSVILTLVVSKVLSLTLLKGEKSAVTLELPPYRKPKIFSLIVRSILDKTLKLLTRAVIISIPAGLILYLLANITIGNASVLTHLTQFLDPFAGLMGLDGVILLAFILGFPANEIVVPIIIMSYMKLGYMIELDELTELKTLLLANGWTIKTAICTMLFSIAHFPCGTTMLTIKKEVGSRKWTSIAFLLPTVLGIILCMIVNLIFSFI